MRRNRRQAPVSDEWIRKYLVTPRRDRTQKLVTYDTLLAVIEQLMEQKKQLQLELEIETKRTTELEESAQKLREKPDEKDSIIESK